MTFGVRTFGTAVIRYARRRGQSSPGQDGYIKAMGGAVLHEIDESLLLCGGQGMVGGVGCEEGGGGEEATKKVAVLWWAIDGW